MDRQADPGTERRTICRLGRRWRRKVGHALRPRARPQRARDLVGRLVVRRFGATASRNARPGRKAGTVVRGRRIGWLLDRSRAVRAARTCLWKVPKSDSVTFWPRATWDRIVSITVSTTLATSDLLSLVLRTTSATSVSLFTRPPSRGRNVA